MEQDHWHSLSESEVLEKLNTQEEGLSEAEVQKRQKLYGLNELSKKKKKSILQLALYELKDPMILILILASILSFILHELVEGYVILFIVLINTIISVVQQKKAEASIEALKSMSAPTAHVIREDSEVIIPASELVIGDIVILEAGSVVPADIRLIETANLKIQESALTGETVPVEKDADVILKPDCFLADRMNMAYTSSLITYGRGVGVVTATGMHTEVGHIASMLNQEDEFDTPLKRKLSAVGKTLTIVGLIVCIVIFVIGLFYQRPMLPLFMTAISLAISIIPEGLPATATIVMALGVKRMAKENALIRKLPAVETLGSSSVICSDKTGTLTQNRMIVKKIANTDDILKNEPVSAEEIENKDEYRDLLYCGLLCNDATFDKNQKDLIIGDPTEGALLLLGRDTFGIDQEYLEDTYERLYEQPFDSDRKRMTTVHQIDGQITAYVKGALDELLSLCTTVQTSHGVREITEEDKQKILNMNNQLSSDALRVLGFAMKHLDQIPEEDGNVEFDLCFLGIVGMMDPPRKEVPNSIKTCKHAGIRTIMITGDHVITAKAIAKELGIYDEKTRAITGTELDQMSDEELDQAVTTTSVFARVSPNHKLRIVNSLKRNGEIVAMTGDGVNDAPALNRADMGISMGINGTDVAKDASDMILLDDDFTTIVYAIKEGRRVYKNIQKVIQFLLAGNVAEILTLFIATLFNWDAPILAIHILCINLATDSLPALALGVDPASKNVMHEKPVRSGTLFERALVTRVILHGIFITIATLSAFLIGYQDSYIVGQTMAFCVLAISQMLHAFNQRSNTDSIFTKGNGHNKSLWLAQLSSFVLLLIILFVPVVRDLFRLTVLKPEEWLITIGLSFLPLVFVEITKWFKRRCKLTVV